MAVLRGRRAAAALLAGALLGRAPRAAESVPTTLCALPPGPVRAPVCVVRGKYALQSAGDFGVQDSGAFASCERCAAAVLPLRLCGC